MTAPHRVGLIVPSSNVTMETELPALLGRHAAVAGRYQAMTNGVAHSRPGAITVPGMTPRS